MLRRSCSPGVRAVWFEHILQVVSPCSCVWLACSLAGSSGCLAEHTLRSSRPCSSTTTQKLRRLQSPHRCLLAVSKWRPNPSTAKHQDRAVAGSASPQARPDLPACSLAGVSDVSGLSTCAKKQQSTQLAMLPQSRHHYNISIWRSWTAQHSRQRPWQAGYRSHQPQHQCAIQGSWVQQLSTESRSWSRTQRHQCPRAILSPGAGVLVVVALLLRSRLWFMWPCSRSGVRSKVAWTVERAMRRHSHVVLPFFSLPPSCLASTRKTSTAMSALSFSSTSAALPSG